MEECPLAETYRWRAPRDLLERPLEWHLSNDNKKRGSTMNEAAEKLPPTDDEIASNAMLWLIAKLCHEVNRIYCASLGDLSQAVWDDAPEWQRLSAYNGVAFHMENPEAGPEGSHENWMREKVAEGWSYGAVKDEMRKEHPCLVPYNQLAEGQRRKDEFFVTICRTMLGA
jgi:hypothetical protein